MGLFRGVINCEHSWLAFAELKFILALSGSISVELGICLLLALCFMFFALVCETLSVFGHLGAALVAWPQGLSEGPA